MAKAAGVSSATVSFVINKPEKVKKETYDRVMQAIRELEYHPNFVAKSMATNQTMQLGIVLEDISNPFSAGLVTGFENAANDKGYFVNVCTTSGRVHDYFESFLERQLDGIFVTALPYKFETDRLYSLVENGVRVIASGNINVDHKRVAAIENDYIDAMDQAISYLHSLGHRSIAYVSGLSSTFAYDLRYAGYIKALKKYGMEFDPRLYVDGKTPYRTGMNEGYRGVESLLGSGARFTAVICTNDLMAIGAIRALEEKGMHVPDDVSVMGFDGIELGKYTLPSLTSMGFDQFEFGKQAFEMLHASMTNNVVGYSCNPLKLIERDSASKCNCS
ncbi:LacI family DNA-binding transcriptional regulator [Lachnoclostridium sp. Marseille-P6806]|uniref:LacI family DNA-binding transcriptional regulator n=1 Tax=Lachnoclostridium sp. Marseille-P6806 TaxID=2364793 RepID=UPI0013EF1412|nr:LacI family DNA-binding transcriptional regulator [Lachnoclostridium sp. Marseille-P6806]